MPAFLPRLSLLFTLAMASLAGCGELQWRKTGADATALAHDLTNCRAQSQERAARMGNIGLPPLSIDPRFGVSGPSQAEQRLALQQSIDACMRAKGYTLSSSGPSQAFAWSFT